MDELNKVLEILRPRVEEIFAKDATGHDTYHLERTMNIALKIQEVEGGDIVVIGVSAYLHDMHRILSNKEGKYCTPEESLPYIAELLKDIDISDERKEHILHAIKHHEEYSFSIGGVTVTDIESLILQDADNLDAIGAIGVGRTFNYGGAFGQKMYIPEIPLDPEENYDEEILLDKSSIHHFYHKLFKLKDNMNTETAKKIAENRHRFMEEFTQEFLDEWYGKK